VVTPSDVSVMTPREVVARVVDPEIRVVTIEELGILREVSQDAGTGKVSVVITPTYSGCPAMEVICADIRRALCQAGYLDVEVSTVLSPAWSTDLISPRGRDKLAAAGIAPPGPVIHLTLSVRCPRCGTPDTAELSRFGATACKSLWRCRGCREPFDRVKPL
jgi:ring-1,2-phenylacetyl-CoA epoxidase subunit PaaD